MGIYELRNFARVIGVSSPTTKLKPQLIDEITRIQQGTLKPNTKSRRGRPPITSFSEELLGKTVSKNLNDLFKKYESLIIAIAELNNLAEHQRKTLLETFNK